MLQVSHELLTSLWMFFLNLLKTHKSCIMNVRVEDDDPGILNFSVEWELSNKYHVLANVMTIMSEN